jgi:REP element-mobilizing transposase RayT
VKLPHNSYSSIYLHITWHTKDNERFLEGKLRNFIYSIIRKTCKETREVVCCAVGGMPDHIHIAVKTPPTLNIAKWIGELKGATSYNVNKAYPEINFSWQRGYGVSSFSDKELPVKLNYINNQEAHHSNNTIIKDLELGE